MKNERDLRGKSFHIQQFWTTIANRGDETTISQPSSKFDCCPSLSPGRRYRVEIKSTLENNLWD